MIYITKNAEFRAKLTEATNASFDCGEYEFRAKEDPAEAYDLILEKSSSARDKVLEMYAELERENALLRKVADLARDAVESGAIDECYLSLLRDAVSALPNA